MYAILLFYNVANVHLCVPLHNSYIVDIALIYAPPIEWEITHREVEKYTQEVFTLCNDFTNILEHKYITM